MPADRPAEPEEPSGRDLTIDAMVREAEAEDGMPLAESVQQKINEARDLLAPTFPGGPMDSSDELRLKVVNKLQDILDLLNRKPDAPIPLEPDDEC